MKKLVCYLAATAMLLLSGCNKYDELSCRVDDLEQRVSALEELCKRMNTNISALQGMVNALEQNDYVTDVTPVTQDGRIVGYTINFTKSQPVTIYHGTDGENGDKGADGKTPQIGVRQDSDGVYYWTVDGNWLLDGDGRKVKAQGNDGDKGNDGITPQFKIEDEYWYVSYDNGTSWNKLGKAAGEQGDSIFRSVDVDDPDFVKLVLADGTELVLPRYVSLSIEFDAEDLVAMSPNSVRDIHYTVKSALPDVELEVVSSADIKAKIVATSATEGTVNIATGAVVDEYSKVVVFASNGEKVIMKRFSFEEAGLKIEDNARKSVEVEGGEVVLEFLTNVAYEVVVSDDAKSWISVVPETRAMEKHTALLKVEANTEGRPRTAVVTVQSQDGSLKATYQIEQKGITAGVAVEVLNLSPDFITISGIEKGMTYAGKATLRITPSMILSAGIFNYHLEHIHLHINDKVYVPEVEIPDGEGLTELNVEVEVPDGDFTVVACYSVQQQFSETGYTMSLEENDAVKLYGVSPDHKYKYFDCYLLVDESYTITGVEFRVGGGEWQRLDSVTGCSFSRSDSVDNVYNVTVRPNYQNVTGDVELRVTGEQHGRYAIEWKNAVQKYLDLEKTVLPAGSIDGEIVVAELWVNDGYYLASVETSASGLEPEIIARAYVRFTMPAEDLTVTLNFKEEIPVSASKGDHIASVTLYNAPDIYYGVPVETGIPGEKVYLLATAETGFKPSKAVAGDDSFDFEFYGMNMYFAPVTIPKDATSLSVRAEAVKAYTATGDGSIYFSAGNVYAEGETVSLTVGVPDGQRVTSVSVRTTDGSEVAVTENLPYATFLMPASDVHVTARFESIGGGDKVSVIAYFDEDQYSVRSSTNYNWDFAEGFTVDRGTTFYLSVYDDYGEPFFVGVQIDGVETVYEADMDEDMGEYSFGKALVADGDVVIRVGATREEVSGGSDQSKTVSVIAYFDEDQYSVRSSTNYSWDFAEGFTVDRGTTFYLSIYDDYGENFYVGVRIGNDLTVYPADYDEDMGEYSFGRSLTASDDMVIKVAPSRSAVE